MCAFWKDMSNPSATVSQCQWSFGALSFFLFINKTFLTIYPSLLLLVPYSCFQHEIWVNTLCISSDLLADHLCTASSCFCTASSCFFCIPFPICALYRWTNINMAATNEKSGREEATPEEWQWKSFIRVKEIQWPSLGNHERKWWPLIQD